MKFFTERNCPVCGAPAEKGRVHLEGNFSMEQVTSFSFSSRKFPEYMYHRYICCSRCEVLFATPVPDMERLQQLYDAADFDSGEESGYAARTYLRTLLRRGAVRAPMADVLDIGASDGKFLQEMHHAGFTGLVGVEPSRKPIDLAPAEIRELIIHDLFRDGMFAPETFSLVTCFQTIEHLPDPRQMLRAVHRVLKEDGLLFIVGHDYKSLCNRILGKKSPIYDIEHMQIFCPAAIRHLLQENGFHSIRVLPVVNTYPVAYWLRLAPVGNHLKSALTSFFRKPGLNNISLSLPVGNMAVFARKGAISQTELS